MTPRITGRAVACLLVLICSIAVFAQQPANYLTPQWYPQYAPVDGNGSDFQLVKAWIEKRTGSKCEVVIERMSGPFPGDAPAELRCARDGKTASVSAVPTFYAPSVSLIDLQRAFGLPYQFIAYTKPEPVPAAQPKPKPARLVGPAIPGTDWYGCVGGDESPDGTVSAQDGETFVKVIRPALIGSSCQWRRVE